MPANLHQTDAMLATLEGSGFVESRYESRRYQELTFDENRKRVQLSSESVVLRPTLMIARSRVAWLMNGSKSMQISVIVNVLLKATGCNCRKALSMDVKLIAQD